MKRLDAIKRSGGGRTAMWRSLWGVPAIVLFLLSAPAAAQQDGNGEESGETQEQRAERQRAAQRDSGIYAIHAAVENPAFQCLVELTVNEARHLHGTFFQARPLETRGNTTDCASMGFNRPITHWTNHWHGQIWLMPGQSEWRIIFLPETQDGGLYRAPGGYYRGRPQGPIDLVMRRLTDEELQELEE